MDTSNSKSKPKVHGGDGGVIVSNFRLGVGHRKARVALNPRKLSKKPTCSCHLKYCNNINYGHASTPIAISSSTTIGNDDDDEETTIIPFPCHAVFIFLDPILLGVVQAEYQNKPKTPSEANPIHMCVFLFAICTYSIVLGLEYYNTNSPSSRLKQTLSYMLLLLGSLSSVSLLSILLRRPLLVWLLIITWGSMQLIIMASQLLKLSSLLCWISEIRMMKLVWKGWDYLVSIALMMGGVIIREIQSQQHLPK